MIISNSTPLINFSMIDKLYILRELFPQIVVPAAVWEEIVIKGESYPTSSRIKEADFIIKMRLEDNKLLPILTMYLSKGEAEAIALSIKQNTSLLLLDEMEARAVAKQYTLPVLGSIGCLIEAKKKGIIDKVKPSLDSMRSMAKFWINQKLYEKILYNEGEGTHIP